MTTTVNKALVALVTPLILAGLQRVGIVPDGTVVDAIKVVVGAVAVWLIPNKPPAAEE